MSIIDAYTRAYERLEYEKTAEAYAEAYGTSDGYLPENYLHAYIYPEKVASEENKIASYAPSTGYLPEGYSEALEKQAFKAISDLGMGLVRSGAKAGQKAGAKAHASDLATRSPMKFKPAADATFGQQMKTHGANLMQRTGQFMTHNPYAATAIGAGGVGLAGYGAYRGLGGGRSR